MFVTKELTLGTLTDPASPRASSTSRRSSLHSGPVHHFGAFFFAALSALILLLIASFSACVHFLPCFFGLLAEAVLVRVVSSNRAMTLLRRSRSIFASWSRFMRRSLAQNAA